MRGNRHRMHRQLRCLIYQPPDRRLAGWVSSEILSILIAFRTRSHQYSSRLEQFRDYRGQLVWHRLRGQVEMVIAARQ